MNFHKEQGKQRQANKKMKESKFTGGLLGMIGTSILVALICGVTFGIAAPWGVCIWQKWLADHTIVDGKQMVFDGNGLQLFGNYIKWALLTVITFGIYSFWTWIKMRQWVTMHTHLVG